MTFKSWHGIEAMHSALNQAITLRTAAHKDQQVAQQLIRSLNKWINSLHRQRECLQVKFDLQFNTQ